MFMFRQKEKHIPGPRTQSFLLDPIDWHLIAIRDVSQTRWQEARSKKPLCLQTYCLKCHGYNWKTSIAINGDKSLSLAIKKTKSRPGGNEGKNLLRKVTLRHTVTTLLLPHLPPTSPLSLYCLHYLLPSCSYFHLRCSGGKFVDLYSLLGLSLWGQLDQTSLLFSSILPAVPRWLLNFKLSF